MASLFCEVKSIKSNDYCRSVYEALSQKLTDPDYEWADVADKILADTGNEVSRDTIRRNSPVAMELLEAGWVRPPESNADCHNSFLSQKLEAQKEIVKLRDERNELARIQRELARRESIIDTIREVIAWNVEPDIGYVPRNFEPADNDLVVQLTDLHAGLDTKNFFNEYNEEVMWQRLTQYLERIDEIRQRHHSERCYLMLGGDLVSGLIHTTLRLENNLNVIAQVKLVSMAIAQFAERLSEMFAHVHVYSVPGNHSRVQPKKEDNLKGESLDILVPFFLSAKLSNFENIHIHEQNVDESVAMFNVRGQKVFGVHGDKDTPENVVQKLTMVWDIKPDIVLMGHRHTNGMRTVYDCKVVESGCLSGTDNYCIDKRFRNKPEQMVLVVSDNGLDCLYDVTLD